MPRTNHGSERGCCRTCSNIYKPRMAVRPAKPVRFDRNAPTAALGAAHKSGLSGNDSEVEITFATYRTPRLFQINSNASISPSSSPASPLTGSPFQLRFGGSAI